MSKIKKGMIILLSAISLLVFSMITVSANDGITVNLDGEVLNFDVPPITQNGRTLVPMRTIFEKLGATVEWDNTTQTATATRDYLTVSITIGSTNMTCTYGYGVGTETESFVLDVPAAILNGRTLIPLRAVSEAFGCTVGWDGNDKTISIIDDNYNLTMLYAPGGRSRAFNWSSVCSQLDAGWFEDESLTYYGSHLDVDSNFICMRCGNAVPPTLTMTYEEQQNAQKVQYISNREVWHNDTNEQFILTFSLSDSTQTIDIGVPAVVRVWIENDNGEFVYDRTLTVASTDFGYWTKNLTGAQTYRCGIYINDWEINCGTSNKGTLYFNVYNEGYFNFDTTKLSISDNLPLMDSYIELPTLPDIVSEYTYDREISTSYKITDISYEIQDDDLTLYFSGEKTYDRKGNNYSQSCKVGWKLFDAEGYVVESGTFYTPNIAVGEKFRNETDVAYGCIKPGETYTLKISDVD